MIRQIKTGIFIGLLGVLFGTTACEKKYETAVLSDYIEENKSLEMDDLIACATGIPEGWDMNEYYPTSVFFYPVQGATDFRYFETNSLADSLDYSKYVQKFLPDEPVFNGYLHRFLNTGFTGERMGIVTYKTPGTLHVCNPIRLKTNPKPTELNNGLVTITENGVTPMFTWTDGIIDENVIYFQVISDLDGNLISGTYTYEKMFEFYNLDNVVLNINAPGSTPVLEPNSTYVFTLMAVSEDNWVNLVAEKQFSTH